MFYSDLRNILTRGHGNIHHTVIILFADLYNLGLADYVAYVTGVT